MAARLNLTDEERKQRRREQNLASYYRHREERVAQVVRRKRARKLENPDYVPRPPRMPDDVRVARERQRCREKQPIYYASHKKEIRESRQASYYAARAASPVKFLVQSARWRAKKRKLPFDLTATYCQTLWTGRCAISGLALSVNKGHGPGLLSPSIDRIVPQRGYVRGNVRFVAMAVNSLKHSGTDEDMLMIARAIVENYKNPNKSRMLAA
ncbi:MAG: hypothetical protein KGL39_39105 [Patescibacteria group bacterium]|nr:hypothetical protein [Patescibacteria group bacterium]